LRGLTEEEARRRLREVGPNALASGQGRSVFRILAETLREPMFLLLVAASLLYLFLGDFGEGLFLVGGALASVGLVVVQEARSERALAALRELAQPHARVLRDGVERQISTRELVPGDILLIGEGERLPADGVLVAGDVLSVDESTLTGESAPVTKQPSPDAPESFEGAAPGAEAGPYVFSGCLVVRGQGVVRIQATGARSALGRIGASLAEIGYEPTPLQKTAGRLAGLLGAVAIAFCFLVAAAYGLLRHDWVGGALAGVTIAISLVPEEFPMVLAVFLALGAWRLANHQVLARRSAVIETLGGATVLCVDKTGTLTENRMRVARLWTGAGDVEATEDRPLDERSASLLRMASLASAVRPVDPMDKAIQALSAEEAGVEGPEPERVWPLRPELLAVIQVWRMPDGGRLTAAKGAPEAVFKLCRLPEDEIGALHAVIQAYAEQGLRVLGVASAELDGVAGDDPGAMQFRFEGLVGFIDPIRQDAPAALEEARQAGVRVLMITGDHPATALAIARSAGIDVSGGVLTGAELGALPEPDLRARLARTNVFARIAPEQKLRIVQALKAEGEVVAMTGDGVNDAPALEAAHIGVAMGRRGTDVAREAADLVLLDNSFASIVGGIRLGRRIFANLRRALTYVTAIHVPIAGLAIAPILAGLPPMLFPMHVVLLELVIDPTCAFVFEAEPSERQAMTRPPRRPDEPLFGPRQVAFALAQGTGVLIAVFGFYFWAVRIAPHTESVARGGAFVALVVGNLVLALMDTASSGDLFSLKRRLYWGIALAVSAVLAVVLGVPQASAIFHVEPPPPPLLAAALLTGIVGGGWSRLLRLRDAPATPRG
jgi:Ca2+-transporting ATPase